jgi:hypothetical protein
VFSIATSPAGLTAGLEGVFAKVVVMLEVPVVTAPPDL